MSHTKENQDYWELRGKTEKFTFTWNEIDLELYL